MMGPSICTRCPSSLFCAGYNPCGTRLLEIRKEISHFLGQSMTDLIAHERIYHITPVPKPRMSRRDRWQKRPCVERYWAFKAECQAKNVVLRPGDSIQFFLPMPQSWSKARKQAMAGSRHLSKPDKSNLTKALEDALYIDDSHLWTRGEEKFWSYEGHFIVTSWGPPHDDRL